MINPRRAVYTALFGSYELLREEPRALDPGADFICLTDDEGLTSETWQVHVVEPRFPMDLVRSARAVKILGHPLVDQYDETIWMDNRVALAVDAGSVFDQLLDGVDMTIFTHSFRDQLVDEFDAVVRGGFDDPHRVYEQLLHYSEHAPDVLEERALWTGFLVRRNSALVKSAMLAWYEHILRYSRRDQLSINVALRVAEGRVSRIEQENRESPWHTWARLDPQSKATRSRSGTTRFQDSIRAPLARVRELGPPNEDLVRAFQDSATAREGMIARLRGELQAATTRLAAIEGARSFKWVRRLQSVRALFRARRK